MPIDPTLPYDDQNIFAKILRGEIPCKKVFEDDWALAFHDINPQAPTHLLVIPKGHHSNVVQLAQANSQVLTELVDAAAQAAELDGVGDGWRFVFNNGAKAGQEVFHCHGHILAGRTLNWPPG